MPRNVHIVSMVLLTAFFMLAGAAPAIAASLTVEWDGNTTDSDLAGYRVYMASSATVFQLTPAAARAQATTRDVTTTSTVFTGLTAGTTSWFGVTAYDTSGNESGFSNIASGVPADTSAPVVSITSPSGGANVSGTISVTANAADDLVVAGVKFRVDGVDIGSEDTSNPWSISWNTTSVTDGAHTLVAVARDAAGNTTTSAAVSVTVGNVDNTPPSVSITAPADGANVSGIVLVTASASDDRAVVGVQFILDGGIGREYTTAPYSFGWNTSTVTDGTHTFRAVARDAAGNTTTSSPVTVTVDNVPNADVTAPTVSVTSPANNASVSGTVTLTSTASDNVGVAGVKFRVDGTDVGSEDTTSPYSVAWNTSAIANGTHTITAVARDAAGNTTTSASVSVTVANADVTAPTVSVTAPANNASVSGTVTLTATAADNVGVAGVKFRVDGTDVGSEDTTSPYSVAWNTSAIANGTHTITAVARDAAGNTTTSASVSVTVANADVTAPTVSVTAPANNATVSGTVTLTATATDNVGVVGVKFRVNGTDVGSEDTTSPYSVAWNTSAIANGTHTITAVARDAAGNTTTSASVSVTVANADVTAPTVSVTAPANNATVSGTVTLTATATDNVGVVGVKFRVDGTDVGTRTPPRPTAWR